MPSTLTVPASKTASTPTAPPGLARRPYLRLLGLGVGLGGLICGGLIYVYLQYGWFESAHRGQVLQIRRMYAEGPHYRVQRPWSIFPQAHRLLHDTFTDNAWTIISTDGAPSTVPAPQRRLTSAGAPASLPNLKPLCQ